MDAYRKDRDWSDQFIPQIKRIVGPLLLEPAEFTRDASEATDLIVLTARDMRIGARIRRAGYAERWPWQFTIRSHRDSGAKTELEKITEGWGDWLFYGHAKQNDQPWIARWFVIDLNAWRCHMIRNRQTVQMGQTPNGDGTGFTWFDLLSFPASPEILVAASHPRPHDIDDELSLWTEAAE